MSEVNLDVVLKKFNLNEKISIYGNGLINDTYISESENYLLQRINTVVFKNPDELMENIERVTTHLRKKITEFGGDIERETLTLVKTVDGENYYKYDDKNSYRLYRFIGGTKTIENDKTNEDLYNAGVGFGRFQKLLDDFPAETLHETIQNFHNTPDRIEKFKDAVKNDVASRASLVKDEIDFVLSELDIADVVTKGIESGKIPVRVTHNDTKINNILFDVETGKAVCVIDLDTVMPGSALYDFGDALRMGGSTAAEDEVDLSKVKFDEECFKAFAKGYLSQTKDILTKQEIELLPLSVRLLTFECGVRFLTDYLNADVYFKTKRPNHNLDRARNQFELCRQLKERETELKAILNDIIEELN